MKGRNIMSGIMILHEILHETKRKNQTDIILKLDFEKPTTKSNGNSCLNVWQQEVSAQNSVDGLSKWYLWAQLV